MDFVSNMERRRIVPLTIGVCIPAMLFSAFLGGMASLLYGGLVLWPDSVAREFARVVSDWGCISGAAAGLAASLWWSRTMVLHARAGRPKSLPAAGAEFGVKAGLAAAVPLHGCLMVVSGRVEVAALAIGMLFGLVAGLVYGVLCGFVWLHVLGREARASKAPEGGRHFIESEDRPEEPCDE